MSGSAEVIRHESRWSPALALLAALLLLAALRGHVFVIPVWVSYLTALVALTSMAAVAITNGDARWLRIERAIILVGALVYVVNTLVELTDMLGMTRFHPPGRSAFSLMSSSVAIWVSNVVAFSLLYWQLDRAARPPARALRARHLTGYSPSPRCRRTCPPAGGRSSSTTCFSPTTRRRRSVPPMSRRSRTGPRC